MGTIAAVAAAKRSEIAVAGQKAGAAVATAIGRMVGERAEERMRMSCWDSVEMARRRKRRIEQRRAWLRSWDSMEIVTDYKERGRREGMGPVGWHLLSHVPVQYILRRVIVGREQERGGRGRKGRGKQGKGGKGEKQSQDLGRTLGSSLTPRANLPPPPTTPMPVPLPRAPAPLVMTLPP